MRRTRLRVITSRDRLPLTCVGVAVRKVNRRRPLRRARITPPPGVDVTELAEKATYVLSREHKDYFTEAGPGSLRSDATPCPRDVTRELAEAWLRVAIAAGHVGAPWSDQPFPQYAWYRTAGVVYEARLSNSELGTYKGYPLDESEWPAWLP